LVMRRCLKGKIIERGDWRIRVLTVGVGGWGMTVGRRGEGKNMRSLFCKIIIKIIYFFNFIIKWL